EGLGRATQSAQRQDDEIGAVLLRRERRQRIARRGFEGRAREETRARIDGGRELEAFGLALLRTDVLVDRHVMRDASLLDERAHGLADRVKPPRLVAIDRLAAPDLAGADAAPQLAVVAQALLAGLQQARIASEHLGFRISGELLECGVGPHEAAVRVGDERGVAGLLQRACDQALALDRAQILEQMLDGDAEGVDRHARGSGRRRRGVEQLEHQHFRADRDRHGDHFGDAVLQRGGSPQRQRLAGEAHADRSARPQRRCRGALARDAAVPAFGDASEGERKRVGGGFGVDGDRAVGRLAADHHQRCAAALAELDAQHAQELAPVIPSRGGVIHRRSRGLERGGRDRQRARNGQRSRWWRLASAGCQVVGTFVHENSNFDAGSVGRPHARDIDLRQARHGIPYLRKRLQRRPTMGAHEQPRLRAPPRRGQRTPAMDPPSRRADRTRAARIRVDPRHGDGRRSRRVPRARADRDAGALRADRCPSLLAAACRRDRRRARGRSFGTGNARCPPVALGDRSCGHCGRLVRDRGVAAGERACSCAANAFAVAARSAVGKSRELSAGDFVPAADGVLAGVASCGAGIVVARAPSQSAAEREPVARRDAEQHRRRLPAPGGAGGDRRRLSRRAVLRRLSRDLRGARAQRRARRSASSQRRRGKNGAMQNPLRWTSRFVTAGAVALAAAAPAQAAAPNVIASLAQPPGGLACSDAVRQTQVVFDFKASRSDLDKISVFINGKGVPESAVSEEWPRLTVLKGLRPGRNTVEVYATTPDGKTEAHTLTVLAGEAPSRDDKDDVAIVDCVGRQVAQRDDRGREVIADDDADEVIEDVRPHVDDDVDEVDRVVYEDAPVYVYYPYPAFRFVSFFPAYYYPAPYYRYYGSYGYRPYPY